jgi:hypothetical protein
MECGNNSAVWNIKLTTFGQEFYYRDYMIAFKDFCYSQEPVTHTCTPGDIGG